MPIASPKYPFTHAALLGAPRLSGVYALFEKDELIYVGRAELPSSIQARLLEHFFGTREPNRATHYSWEVSRDALARQKELVEEFERVQQRPPRYNGGPSSEGGTSHHRDAA